MIHLNFDTFKTEKIVFELRFKEAFKLPISDTKYKILDRFTKKYSVYNTDNAESLSFMDPETNNQLHIQLNRILIDCDKPGSMDDFTKKFYPDITFISSILDIKEFIRVGFRTFHSFEGNNASSISEYIFKEYISADFKSPKLADEFFNPLVQFSGKKGMLTFNFTISQQQEKVIQGTLGSNQVFNETIRDLMIIDLDCYKENIKSNKIDSFFTQVKAINAGLPNYIQTLKGGK